MPRPFVEDVVDHGVASNAHGDKRFDLETYIECVECEVSNEDGKEIAQYLGTGAAISSAIG